MFWPRERVSIFGLLNVVLADITGMSVSSPWVINGFVVGVRDVLFGFDFGPPPGPSPWYIEGFLPALLALVGVETLFLLLMTASYYWNFSLRASYFDLIEFSFFSALNDLSDPPLEF